MSSEAAEAQPAEVGEQVEEVTAAVPALELEDPRNGNEMTRTIDEAGGTKHVVQDDSKECLRLS